MDNDIIVEFHIHKLFVSFLSKNALLVKLLEPLKKGMKTSEKVGIVSK